MNITDIAIIVPAYNESESVASVIQAVRSYGKVIVINDCSSDDTEAVAVAAGAIVVSHSKNKGYDGALSSGMSKAHELGCQFAITFDADGQHTTESLQVFIDKLEEGVELVLGVRPEPARIAERLYALVARRLWGIHDPLCGMKGYNMNLWVQNKGFDHCQSIGSELAIQSIRNGAVFEEVSIPILDREFGNPRFGQSFRANWKIVTAMLRVLCLRKK